MITPDKQINSAVDKIRAGAQELGACNKANGIRSFADVANSLFSPQGREFALKHDFPTIELWRSAKSECSNLSGYEIYVDVPTFTLHLDGMRQHVALIGDTTARINIDAPDALHHIILMHGASVEVNASNYATFTLEADKSSAYILNLDNTAKRL